MEGLAETVLLMAVVPGALVGLLRSRRLGAINALIGTLIGAAGGLGGAALLGGLTGRLGLDAGAVGPLSVIVGSVVGALLLLAIAGWIRGMMRTQN